MNVKENDKSTPNKPEIRTFWTSAK